MSRPGPVHRYWALYLLYAIQGPSPNASPRQIPIYFVSFQVGQSLSRQPRIKHSIKQSIKRPATAFYWHRSCHYRDLAAVSTSGCRLTGRTAPSSPRLCTARNQSFALHTRHGSGPGRAPVGWSSANYALTARTHIQSHKRSVDTDVLSRNRPIASS